MSYHCEIELTCSDFYKVTAEVESDTFFGAYRQAIEAYEGILVEAMAMEAMIPEGIWGLGLQFPDFRTGVAEQGCGSGLNDARSSIPSFYHWMLIVMRDTMRKEKEIFAAVEQEHQRLSLRRMSEIYRAGANEDSHANIKAAMFEAIALLESAVEDTQNDSN